MARDNTRVPSEEDVLRKRVQEWQTLAGEFPAKISELEGELREHGNLAWRQAVRIKELEEVNRLVSEEKEANWRHFVAECDETTALGAKNDRLRIELAAALDHLDCDSELGKRYRAELAEQIELNDELQTYVVNLKKAINTWTQTVEDWKTIAQRWEDNYSDVVEKYNDLRAKQVDRASAGTVNLTVNLDTEDALAKLNELVEVAKQLEERGHCVRGWSLWGNQ